MKNIIDIGGYKAGVAYDPDLGLFRGEFVGLNGGADFYAADVDGLRREGALSLKVFLDMCREDGVEPRKTFSGKFNLRIPAQLHERIASVAAAEGKSLNQWVAEALEREAMRDGP